ncbi:hypothetical protein PCC7424_1550 [Gloeothece citriformis PCC 7424]|uniref:Uncharacterized protein n=1 Tax=Gloeothece citriformis (strain PCC 7424) TaxID=65393 RepID=B7K9M2_GLOC7|nr:hypothetical protein [Gloeothece citriformis]ACK69990.1 hypothetical protein PCC7424_1550 [Gloeothece citriformis PCC 7424]
MNLSLYDAQIHLLLGVIFALVLSPVLLWLFPKIIRFIPTSKP